MNYALAAIGSVTTAVRLKNEALVIGVSNIKVVHTPSHINKGGCSYSLKFPLTDISLVKRAAQSSNIQIKGLYEEVKNGRESVYNAIS